MNNTLSDGHRLYQVRGPNGPSTPDGPNRSTDPNNPYGPPGPNRPGPGLNNNNQRPRGGWFIWRWLLLIVVGLILWQVAEFFFTGSATAGACTLPYGTFYH